MLREMTSWLAVVLLVGAVCGFAWLTQHPETPWLESAEEWPLAGPLAERFRRAYLGPPPEERAAAGGGDRAPVVVVLGGDLPDEPIDLTGDGPYSRSRLRARTDAAGGSPASRPAGGAEEGPREEERRLAALDVPDLAQMFGGGDGVRFGEATVPQPQRYHFRGFPRRLPPTRADVEREWLLPGTVLREAPAPSAAEVESTRELASVPVLERQGEWLRVRLRGRDGWADPSTPATEVGKAGFAAFRGRHWARPRRDALSEAKRRLGLRRPNGRLGPFPLYTDVEDPELLALLDGVAQRLDEAYGARFGLGLPARRAPPEIALFATEADFRALARAIPGAPQHVRGLAPGGLVVFYVGEDNWQVVITGFVHELVHTLNRQTLGPSLPPWLEEGMAEDLSGVWIEEPDAPSPGMAHPGDAVRYGWTLQEIVVAGVLGAQDGVWSPAAELTALDRTGFFGADRRFNYVRSFLFVRCLLDGGDGRFADGFRRFLDETANGHAPEPRRLVKRVGADWPEIERVCSEHRSGLAEEASRLLPEWASFAGISGSVHQPPAVAGRPAGER